MATKKQKRAAGIAKREKEEAENRERGLHFLSLAQSERAAERSKAEASRKERAVAKSKRLARAHEAAKASKPGEHKTADAVAAPKNKQGRYGRAGSRKKQFNKAKNPRRGPRINGTDQEATA